MKHLIYATYLSAKLLLNLKAIREATLNGKKNIREALGAINDLFSGKIVLDGQICLI